MVSREQVAVRKFSASRDLSFIKRKRFAPSNLADTVQPIQQPAAKYALFHAKLRQVASRELEYGAR